MKNYFLVLLLLAGTTSLLQSGSDCDEGVLVENDSYFWVVTQLSDFVVNTGYKIHTTE